MFYTPPSVAARVVRHTLQPLLAQRPAKRALDLLIVDPACGDGVFLEKAFQFLDAHYRRVGRRKRIGPAARKRIVLAHLFGVDKDFKAVESTKQRLARLCLGASDASTTSDIASLADELSENIQLGDAIVDEPARGRGLGLVTSNGTVRPFDWRTRFATVFHRGGFHAVIGNPPFVNIRQLTSSHGAWHKEFLRGRYRCARRGFDLYVVFLERAFQILRAGGVCGFIVPNKLASMDYAVPCRRMLLEQATLSRIDDLTRINAFPGADVYPYIVVWKKARPAAGHHIDVQCLRSRDELSVDQPTHRVRQADLSAERGLTIHGELDVESRVPTAPLGLRAQLQSGTTGFEAQRLADELTERDQPAAHRRAAHGFARTRPAFEFIVSGNIDRYQVRLGNVRFMKAHYLRPVLPENASLLSDGKRRLFREPKIVVAGLTRRLEAAWDAGGLALGVQVYAAAKLLDHPLFVLGLLNSSLMSYVFQIRFQAKRLASGYLAINKSQLATLPIRTLDLSRRSQQRIHARMVRCVSRMIEGQAKISQESTGRGRSRIQRAIDATDREIDRLVYELYELTSDEIARVEEGLGKPPSGRTT